MLRQNVFYHTNVIFIYFRENGHFDKLIIVYGIADIYFILYIGEIHINTKIFWALLSFIYCNIVNFR